MKAPVNLLLASQSPRRLELLRQIGVNVEVLNVNVPEIRQENELPSAYVQRLACAKAFAGANLQSALPVLGADTVVVHEGRVIEKPSDEQHAKAILSALSGQSHEVLTAVAMTFKGNTQVALSRSIVTFKTLSDQVITAYCATQEPLDKAGAYGIQGLAAVFVERLEGSYSAVMGLPLCETAALLEHYNVPYWT